MPLRVPDSTALLAALALLVVLTSACVSPSGPKPLRYYSGQAPLSAEGQPASAAALELRPRFFEAAGHLRERMAVHVSEVEYLLLEDDRWTEAPLAYVRRALEREMFELAGLRRSESLATPALDLELFAFEKTQIPALSVEIGFTLVLTDADGGALLERSFLEREDLTDDSAAGVAIALSRALSRVSARAAAALRTALAPQ